MLWLAMKALRMLTKGSPDCKLPDHSETVIIALAYVPYAQLKYREDSECTVHTFLWWEHWKLTHVLHGKENIFYTYQLLL